MKWVNSQRLCLSQKSWSPRSDFRFRIHILILDRLDARF
jgi:hypothetical protein